LADPRHGSLSMISDNGTKPGLRGSIQACCHKNAR